MGRGEPPGRVPRVQGPGVGTPGGPPRATSLAWVSDLLDEQRTVLGHDPWCYAFGPNRENLATAIRWAHEQGLIDHPFPPEDLFVPSTLDVLPTYV